MCSLVQCYGSAGTHSTGYVLQCVSVVLYGMFVPIMTLILCTTLYPGETPSSLLPACTAGRGHQIHIVWYANPLLCACLCVLDILLTWLCVFGFVDILGV